MRLPLAAILSLASAAAGASPATMGAHMPAHKAFDSAPARPAQGCVNGDHLSQAAYVQPAFTPSAEHGLRCSELLSTDTLMKIRRWDRT